jgi:hypothetical protein
MIGAEIRNGFDAYLLVVSCAFLLSKPLVVLKRGEESASGGGFRRCYSEPRFYAFQHNFAPTTYFLRYGISLVLDFFFYLYKECSL